MSGIQQTTTEKAEQTTENSHTHAHPQTEDKTEKSVEEQFKSLSLGDMITFEGRKPLVVTGDFTDNPFHAHAVLRGPRGGRHIVAMSGAEHSKSLSMMKDDYITVDREINESEFRIVNRQDPEDSDRVSEFPEDKSKD